jgi:hypothetical protein
VQITNDIQARYAAAQLSKPYETGKLEKLLSVFLRSGLEVYLHQTEAVACALYNPYSKGYILADEIITLTAKAKLHTLRTASS